MTTLYVDYMTTLLARSVDYTTTHLVGEHPNDAF